MDENIVEEVKGRYQPRVIDDRITELLRIFGGVYITGPKWCGKSWTGIHHSKSVLFVGKNESKILAELDPETALEGERPRLVDEWQIVSNLWDVARWIIDLEPGKGAFIFTGSVTVPEDATLHTGTGRFANLRMRPLSLFESGNSSGAVSLSDMFDGAETANIRSPMDYKEAVRLICRGGWPAAIGMDDEDAVKVPNEYIISVINSSTSEKSGRRKNKTTMSLLLRSIARNSAESPTMNVFANDISGGSAPLAENTVKDYLETVKNIFLIDEQEAWRPSLRSKTRLRASSKIHYVDPSLAVAALKASQEVLIRNPSTAGQLFESLCYRDLCIYTSALGGNVYHYRDESELEIDEIIELDDGRWGAIEVKLGTHEIDKAAANLVSLKNKVSEDMPEPSFLAVLCANSGLAYKREDGVRVIPLDLLGP